MAERFFLHLVLLSISRIGPHVQSNMKIEGVLTPYDEGKTGSEHDPDSDAEEMRRKPPPQPRRQLPPVRRKQRTGAASLSTAFGRLSTASTGTKV